MIQQTRQYAGEFGVFRRVQARGVPDERYQWGVALLVSGVNIDRVRREQYVHDGQVCHAADGQMERRLGRIGDRAATGSGRRHPREVLSRRSVERRGLRSPGRCG